MSWGLIKGKVRRNAVMTMKRTFLVRKVAILDDLSANDGTILKAGETDSSISKGVTVVSQTNC